MSAPRYLTACEQCGQTDDDPKVHIGDVTKHHDCLSAAEEAMVTGSSPIAAQIIEAAKSGTRGGDLLAHIGDLHADPTTSQVG